METPRDDVDARKNENPACAHLTSFYFIAHENFELRLDPTTLDMDAFATALGPTALEDGDLEDIAPAGVTTSASVGAYAAQHGVRSLWVYAYRRGFGDSLEFRAELWIDENGNVHTLDRARFDAARPAGDDEADDVYRKRFVRGTRREWRFAEIATLTCGATWHFYGSRVRLRCDDALRLDNVSYFRSDPGSASLYRQGSAALVRVLDPLKVGEQMNLECNELLAKLRAFEFADAPGANKDVIERRNALVELAHYIELNIERVASAKGELAPSEPTWDELAKECFTSAEQAILKTMGAPHELGGPGCYLAMVHDLRKHYLGPVRRCAVKMLKWIRSPLWKFAQDSHFRSVSLMHEHAPRLFEVFGPIAATLAEVQPGQGHLLALLRYLDENPNSDAVPNQRTIETFAEFDPANPPTWIDSGKRWTKVAMLSLELGARLAAISIGRKEALLAARLKTFPALRPRLAVLTKQQQMIAAIALTATHRANVLCGSPKVGRVFKLDLIEGSHRASIVVDKQRRATKVTPPPRWVITVENEIAAKKRLAAKIEKIKHVVNGLNGVLALVATLDAVGQSRLETAKNATEFFKSVYDLPGVGTGLESWLKGGSDKVGRKVLAKSVGFTLASASFVGSVWGYFDKRETGSTEEQWAAGLDSASDLAMLMALIVGSTTPIGLVLGVVGVVLGGAGFLFDYYKPTEAELAVRYSRFGSEYHAATTEKNERATPWQACPGQDLRYFNPAHGGGVEAYRRQIRSFWHLLCAFRVKAVRSPDEARAGVELTAGTIPRGAYFEIEADISAKAENGATWSYPKLAFCYSPDEDDGRHGQIWRKTGGPFEVEITGPGPAAPRVMIGPTPGDSIAWTGKLVADGAREVHKRSHARTYYALSAKKGSVHELELRSSSTTAKELVVEAYEIDAVYEARLPDSSLPGPDQRATIVGSGSKVDVPAELPESNYATRLKGVRVRVTYRDAQSPQTPPQITKFGPLATPSARRETQLDDYLDYVTVEKFYARLDYTASIVHDDKKAIVTLRFGEQFLSATASGSWMPTKSIAIDKVNLEYQREGEATPRTFALVFFGDEWIAGIKDGNEGSLELGTKVHVGASALQHGAWLTQDALKGPFEVRAGYGDPNVDANSREPHVLTEVDLRVRMVIEGMPKEQRFMPDDLTRDDYLAWVTVGLTTEVPLDLPDVGVMVPNRKVNGEASALEACRSKRG